MTKRAFIVAGLGFGDEGKGTIVDTLCREFKNDRTELPPLVVRYNGGAQAAHHVVSPEGSHCFSQFGSGMLAGARTFLSENMIIDPPAMFREAQHLETLGVSNPFNATEIHPMAPIVTPWHRALNQLREVARGAGKHGSCGRGIGEVVREVTEGRQPLIARELRFRTLRGRAMEVRERLIRDAQAAGLMHLDHWAIETLERQAAEWAHEMERATMFWKLSEQPLWPDVVVFEGAQGVLLDQWQGFHPFTTWSTTTFDWAHDIIAAAPVRYTPVRVGVIRSYLTRHGAGPFPTETVQMNHCVKDDANNRNDWQGHLRVGHFDLMLLHYAIEACGGVDTLAVTHLDKVGNPWDIAHAYRVGALGALMTELPVYRDNRGLDFPAKLTGMISGVQPVYTRLQTPYELLHKIEAETGVKVGICSWGPGTGPDHKTITDGCPCRKDVKSLLRLA